MKGLALFERGDIYEIAKIHESMTFENLLLQNHWANCSRTTGQISTKQSTKHPLVMCFQVNFKEGPCPFSSGDTYEIAKIH